MYYYSVIYNYILNELISYMLVYKHLFINSVALVIKPLATSDTYYMVRIITPI